MTVPVQYDSDDLDAIPDTAAIVAFYNDGEPGTPTAAQLARHKNAILVPITRVGGRKAFWIDVEYGAATVDDARGDLGRGLVEGVYFSESRQPEIDRALNGLTYYRWVALYDRDPTIDRPEWDAKQYASPTSGSGGHYDLSSIGSRLWQRYNGNQPTGGEMFAASHPNSPGYWIAKADGSVYAFGAAQYHGGGNNLPGGQKMGAPCCGIISTPSGNGYWLLDELGQTYAFGDAQPFGNVPA